MTSQAATVQQDLSAEAFDILLAAVNLARFRQVKTVASLRQQLAQAFPKTDASVIDQALRFWAERNLATGANYG